MAAELFNFQVATKNITLQIPVGESIVELEGFMNIATLTRIEKWKEEAMKMTQVGSVATTRAKQTDYKIKIVNDVFSKSLHKFNEIVGSGEEELNYLKLVLFDEKVEDAILDLQKKTKQKAETTN